MIFKFESLLCWQPTKESLALNPYEAFGGVVDAALLLNYHVNKDVQLTFNGAKDDAEKLIQGLEEEWALLEEARVTESFVEQAEKLQTFFDTTMWSSAIHAPFDEPNKDMGQELGKTKTQKKFSICFSFVFCFFLSKHAAKLYEKEMKVDPKQSLLKFIETPLNRNGDLIMTSLMRPVESVMFYS